MVRPALVAALAASTSALSIKRREAAQNELFTIELAPGLTKVVTQDEKFALKMDGKNFIDITNHPNLASSSSGPKAVNKAAAVTYPSEMSQSEAVTALISKLNTSNMEAKLTTFSDIFSRYYELDTGKDASDWVLAEVKAIVSESGAAGVTVEPFSHSFVQQSVIATIPGQSEAKVIIGAHLDSVNGRDRAGRSPGADDDGSGTVTIMEALKALLSDPRVAAGAGANTLEFHWYAGEEGGLLGSADVFDRYSSDGADVKAMLQQDMTGYDAGPMGVITDYVDGALTEFVHKVIDAYTEIGYVDTECGYGCSDHASASAAGYPSSFVIEGDFAATSPYIHTADDTMDTVSVEHMLEHAKLVTGFAYELAFAAL
ncbi:leucine aminopeptidase 1 [Biscogniauxia mediterranea]|nr:leucine aminopeptidase 1 [Biscogniauxia mediterranea]